MLFQQEPFQNIRIADLSNDIFVRYVSLHNTSGISVAYYDAEILAIVSHEKGREDSSIYKEAGDYAVWTHCPLVNESILEIWWIYHGTLDLKTSALAVSSHFE
jgi:hypothetical protein